MSAARVFATAVRVLRQLRHDPRTLAMLFVVAPALLALMRGIFNSDAVTFARVGAPMIGLFPLTLMFLITSITMLRERTTGTLERLMSLPIAKADLLFGYAVAFAVVAAAQATVTGLVGFELLGITTAGPAWTIVALAIGNALLGMSLGLFTSAFARSEFQAIQFMPALLFPQILLSGLLVPRALMPSGLQAVSDVLPVSYAYDGLSRVTSDQIGSRLAIDVAVVTCCILGFLALAAATLRRRTA
ncbi:MAG TPA: ABC transporter permease [Thermoleophilia bacterium]|nr:ABC transporter permease [Thermoleophilia bacterium]